MRPARLVATWILAACTGLVMTFGAQAALVSVDRSWAARQAGLVFFVHTRTPAVALTFDDGPNPADTPRVLAELRAAHAQATFFVLGNVALRYPDLLRAIVAQGSEIGLHSWNHPNMARLGTAAIAQQLRRTVAAVQEVAGMRPTLFRFPYFSHSPQAVQAVRDLGYTVVEASVDPKDWSHPGVEAIVRRATDDVRPGDILLFHDGGGQSQTVAALPHILSALRVQGLQLVTVGQLLQLGPPSYQPPEPPAAPEGDRPAD